MISHADLSTALLALLDDAALATGQSFWSDAHLAGLGAADRKVFKKHYDAVVAAIAVRGAYLTWLVGAVCRTPEGLKRALEVARTGTSTARLVTGNVLARTLTTPEQQKQFAAAIDPAEWNGKDQALERLYRSAVIAFSNATRRPRSIAGRRCSRPPRSRSPEAGNAPRPCSTAS